MPKEVKSFYIVFLLFVLTLLAIPIIGQNANEYVGYAIFLLCVVLLPLLVVFSKDALLVLNNSNQENKFTMNFVRLLASMPTLIFGLLGIGIGLAIIAWVLYNFLIERQPEFNGSSIFVGFGIAPGLVYFGVSALKSIIGKNSSGAQ